MKDKIKCEKCGMEMNKGDPYLDFKGEGEESRKDLSDIYHCSNPKCVFIKIIPDNNI